MNFQQQTDQMLTQLSDHATLLLHSCCGPCSSYVLSYLSRYFSRITVLYYNPCIHPKEEFEKRLAEQRRLIDQMPTDCPVDLWVPPYEPQTFFHLVTGMEHCPEGGERCKVCFEQRLQETARLAQEKNYTHFATTLTVSPHKNAMVINEVGQTVSQATNTVYLPSDFKKKEGYKQSLQLSAQYGLYRQNYCGCIFSKEASHGTSIIDLESQSR
ncbi:MAG: epoxyqueuosine reductase QueH [Clostridia bacterium]|nr:epoxyqueuosine reductase QueH [Clostridia bacterium]